MALLSELNQLEGETLDSDFADPRFDPILERLKQISPESPRYQDARAKVEEIESARRAAAQRKQEVADTLASLRARPGGSGAPVHSDRLSGQSAEERHRQLVRQISGPPRVSGVPPDTRPPLVRAQAVVANQEKYVRALEASLRTACGPAESPSRSLPACVERQADLDRRKAQLEALRQEVKRLKRGAAGTR